MAAQLSAKEKKRLEQQKTKFRRSTNIKPVKQTFLIVCEGKNTEPDYFNAFRLTSAHVKALGNGYNTLSLITSAIQIKQQEAMLGKRYNQHWVVFDKDDWTASDFNSAIFMAKANGFKIAYSNQAFEFWYILHFAIMQGAIHRNQYEAILSRHLGFRYAKDSATTKKLFDILLPLQQTAISNAIRVYDAFGEPHSSPSNEESSTTVHKLVTELNKYI
jgi:hypothetical protein